MLFAWTRRSARTTSFLPRIPSVSGFSVTQRPVHSQTQTRNNIHHSGSPLPPLEVQKEIVAEIEGYQKVINGARAEITRFDKKIQDTISRVWDE